MCARLYIAGFVRMVTERSPLGYRPSSVWLPCGAPCGYRVDRCFLLCASLCALCFVFLEKLSRFPWMISGLLTPPPAEVCCNNGDYNVCCWAELLYTRRTSAKRLKTRWLRIYSPLLMVSILKVKVHCFDFVPFDFLVYFTLICVFKNYISSNFHKLFL